MGEKKCVINLFFTKLKETIQKLFGEPGKGVHSHRIFNIAYIDVIATFIGAYLLQKVFYPKTKYLKVLFFLFLLGIVLHRLFDVRTTVDKLLF
ncbi:MAG: hypothetical protein CL885_05040 [Dehalococcoidia bacterium]|nr:hypothetical protein [Dehalococcoidia bacterium]|tara:strand:+ start:660 stop:938 length:279 start_codon:yes stop_codon:yes gene_type:complete